MNLHYMKPIRSVYFPKVNTIKSYYNKQSLFLCWIISRFRLFLFFRFDMRTGIELSIYFVNVVYKLLKIFFIIFFQLFIKFIIFRNIFIIPILDFDFASRNELLQYSDTIYLLSNCKITLSKYLISPDTKSIIIFFQI